MPRSAHCPGKHCGSCRTSGWQFYTAGCCCACLSRCGARSDHVACRGRSDAAGNLAAWLVVAFAGHLFGQSYSIPGLPFSADVVFISSAYFLLGYLLRSALRAHKTSLIGLLVSVVLFGMIFFFIP